MENYKGGTVVMVVAVVVAVVCVHAYVYVCVFVCEGGVSLINMRSIQAGSCHLHAC